MRLFVRQIGSVFGWQQRLDGLDLERHAELARDFHGFHGHNLLKHVATVVFSIVFVPAVGSSVRTLALAELQNALRDVVLVQTHAHPVVDPADFFRRRFRPGQLLDLLGEFAGHQGLHVLDADVLLSHAQPQLRVLCLVLRQDLGQE